MNNYMVEWYNLSEKIQAENAGKAKYKQYLKVREVYGVGFMQYMKRVKCKKKMDV